MDYEEDTTSSAQETLTRPAIKANKRHLDLPTEQVASDVPQRKLIRVMTYNIGNTDETYASERLEAVVKIVKTNEPDIVCLHDVSRKTLDGLQAALENIYLQFHVFVDENNATGTLLMLRYDSVEIPDSSQPYYYDFTQGEGRIMGTELVHQVSGFKFHMLTTKLEEGADNDHIRQAQYQVIEQVIKPLKNFILVGDFNIHKIREEAQCMLDNSKMTDIWYTVGCPSLIQTTKIRTARIYTCTSKRQVTPVAMTVVGTRAIGDTIPVTPASHYGLVSILEIS